MLTATMIALRFNERLSPDVLSLNILANQSGTRSNDKYRGTCDNDLIMENKSFSNATASVIHKAAIHPINHAEIINEAR